MSGAVSGADRADGPAGEGEPLDGVGTGVRLSVLDRALYALFSRHADATRHVADRKRYRGTDLRVSFDVFLSRVYAASWGGSLFVAVAAGTLVASLPPGLLAAAGDALGALGPFAGRVSSSQLALGGAALAGIGAKRGVVLLGGAYLRWLAAARRADIERTLPGAVRYLHALSSGSDDARAMLRRVAERRAYGGTATALRKALNAAALTGSLQHGLRRTARDTPSRDLLSPFLLKFREHADQGGDALSTYLRMESRMLGHRQSRAREQSAGFLELLAELFIVLLVLPALFVIVLTVMGVLAPGLSDAVATPFGSVTLRAAIVYGSAAFILVVGAAAALLVEEVRPHATGAAYERPDGLLATLRSVPSNPASAALVLALPALALGVAVLRNLHPASAALSAYVAFAVPVGAVAVRRGRLDDAKDREITDFVHAVSGHVSLGRPFPEAVRLVARDVDLGPLNPDVADLAFNLSLGDAVPADGGRGRRRVVALERFADRVGTTLAAQSMGLVTGALDAGSDAEAVFETLQAEVGHLYHERRALRSAMLVYVAVGWTTALLVVGITVAVNQYVLDGFAQLSGLSGTSGLSLDPNAVQPERDRFRFYVVAQATMLAAGWFAGVASRGRYEALLHSGLLVAACATVFAGVGP